jgi:hypothetical protein
MIILVLHAIYCTENVNQIFKLAIRLAVVLVCACTAATKKRTAVYGKFLASEGNILFARVVCGREREKIII